MFGNFGVIIFVLKYFMVMGNHEQLFTYVEKMEDYKRDLYVRSFHMYCDIWEVAVGEVLDCERTRKH